MDKNTLFFLIPKEQVEYLLGSDTVKQVLEKVENTQKAYPMIAKRHRYCHKEKCRRMFRK